MPDQMFTHGIDPRRGWFDNHALTYVAPLSANITLDPVPAGRVVHLNASGEFELGAQLGQVAMFIRGGSAQPDSANDGDGDTDIYGWTAAQPDATPKVAALVSLGAYEIASTEFDSVATYAPNDILHAPTEAECTAAAGVANAGKLFKDKTYASGGGSIAAGTQNVCGIVSKGVYKNHWRIDVLAFWPHFERGSV